MYDSTDPRGNSQVTNRHITSLFFLILVNTAAILLSSVDYFKYRITGHLLSPGVVSEYIHT